MQVARITPTLRRLLDAIQEPLTGAWEDVGHGRCVRCGDRRRLYSPLAQPDIRSCAPCAQVFASVSLYQLSRDMEAADAAGEDTDEADCVLDREDVVEDTEVAESYVLVDGKLVAVGGGGRSRH